MQKRVGLIVSSPDSLEAHVDREVPVVAEAMKRLGVSASAVPWTADTDWGEFHALVLKSPWDYSMRTVEFAGWLRTVEKDTTVLNHPELVRWNLDKRYLQALAEFGVNVTPVTSVGSAAQASSVLGQLGGRIVVKPSVSAGSRDTGLFAANDPKALDLVATILSKKKIPMISRSLDSIQLSGEHGLLYFGGTFSHCGHKAPILAMGGGYLHGNYTETVRSARARPDEISLGEKCLEAISEISSSLNIPPRTRTPLYARLDIADDNEGKPCILEAELFEPSYFLHLDPHAADRFAMAVLDSLEGKS